MKLFGSACCSHAQPRRGLRMTMAAHNEKKEKRTKQNRVPRCEADATGDATDREQ